MAEEDTASRERDVEERRNARYAYDISRFDVFIK